MINPVLKTTFAIIKKSWDVKINHDSVRAQAKIIAKQKKIAMPTFRKFHFTTKDKEFAARYVFVLDTLNFCFWSKGERWTIFWRGKKYNGYFALAICLKDFFEKYPEKANFKYFSAISFSEFKNLFQGGKNLQFLKKRWQMLRAVSRVLEQKYTGSALRFVSSAKYDALSLLQKIRRELCRFLKTRPDGKAKQSIS